MAVSTNMVLKCRAMSICFGKRTYFVLFLDRLILVLICEICRIPKSTPLRQNWIRAIKEHQNFTEMDDRSTIYNVCSLHFDPTSIKHSKTGNTVTLVPGTYPTRFPTVENELSADAGDSSEIIMDVDPIETMVRTCADPAW